MKNEDGQCPWCGAEKSTWQVEGKMRYECGSVSVFNHSEQLYIMLRERTCYERQIAQLHERLEKSERLFHLVEELGEVVQIVGKVLRFGWENYHPQDVDKTTNRTLLENELRDVMAAITLMTTKGDINEVMPSEE